MDEFSINIELYHLVEFVNIMLFFKLFQIRYGNYNAYPDAKEKGMECLKFMLDPNKAGKDNTMVKIDSKDYKGMTPLHLAAIQMNDSYVVELIGR